MLRWLVLSLLVILLDQVTKYYAVELLELHQPVEVLPFFNWTLMYNEGAAFSFLSDQGGWQRWFFIALATVVTGVLIGWMAKLKRSELALAVALSLVIGGAVGNVIDRILLGKVVDFIHLHYEQYYWPAFNVADSAITIGVVILIFDALFNASKEEA